MTKFRLVVSDVIQYVARFTFLDGMQPREFRARMQARRMPGAELEAALRENPGIADFLRGRDLELVGWDGDNPLVDEFGNPAPPGADALAALLAEPNVPSVMFAAYLDANGAKAKLGN